MSSPADTNGPDVPSASGRGHPPALYLLFFVEMWERFSFYGMRALLVLYLIALTSHQFQLARTATVVGTAGSPDGTGTLTAAGAETLDSTNPGRGWAEADANLLYGWYGGLGYLLPVIGGLLADRFLGTHRSVVIGALLITLGHIVLGVAGFGSLPETPEGLSVFIGGLALIIVGTGFFKPCMSVMVGQLYPQKDPRRDGAYTIFYMGVNLGGFIGPLVVGFLGEQVGWHWGFGAAAVGMVGGLLMYLFLRHRYLPGIGEAPPGAWSMTPVVMAGGGLLLAAAAALAYHAGVFGSLRDEVGKLMENAIVRYTVISTFVLAVVGAVLAFTLTRQRGDRGAVGAIFIFMLFNAVFWIAFEQAGSTLNVFAARSTDRNLFGLWEVPATWFQSINGGLILLMGPLFVLLWPALARRNLNPSQPVKIGLGLLFLGVGYVFIVIGAMLNASGALVSMFWLVAMYTLHTIGELILSPTGLSFVNKVAPKRSIALLVGVWYISNFMAYLGGGFIGSYVKKIESGELALPWYSWGRLGGRADYFAMFVVSSFAAGVLVLGLSPLLKRLYQGRE